MKHFVFEIAYRPLAQMLSTHAIGVEVLGSNPGPVNLAQCRQRFATVASFLQSCVAQALSRGDGTRHSSHASALHGEYDEDLIFLFLKLGENIATISALC